MRKMFAPQTSSRKKVTCEDTCCACRIPFQATNMKRPNLLPTTPAKASTSPSPALRVVVAARRLTSAAKSKSMPATEANDHHIANSNTLNRPRPHRPGLNLSLERVKLAPVSQSTGAKTKKQFSSCSQISRLVISTIIFVSLTGPLSEAQCPERQMTSFERVGGVTLKDSMLLTVLYTTAPNMSSLHHHHHLHHHLMLPGAPDLSRQLAALPSASSLNIPITAECNNRCRRSAKCRAFLVDYGRHTCYSVESTQSPSLMMSGLARAPPPIHLVATQERMSYFEKVCLNSPPIDCDRAWVYERVMAHHIHGHDDKIIEDVPSRLKCQEHCLNEREFRCRSGEYDNLNMQCRLSMIDRHIKPNSFRPTSSNVDYFENQCVPVGNQCDAFDRFENQDLGQAEIMRSANTSDQCQQICTQIVKAFICRSFTWNPVTGKCYLNSVNTFMVGGTDRLMSAPGLTYFQRNDCIDLKLECDTTAMTLNLRTNEPFRGRMYVRDDPNSCETVGRSALISSLSIPFQSQARCATRELPSRYSSVVVVQQHPMIQRKTDRYIKVVCDFQTANKTITSHYNVAANPWTSTALINATSFAPKIRLRITDKYGVDITGAKLGDELNLRIEAETESVYDMVARSVLAKSGTTDESLALIDKDGCPTDYRIFPPLRKLNRRTIIGKFDAFKFSSDVVVRFQVDVQFCLNQCPVSHCDHNLLMNSNAAGLDPFGLTTMSPISPQPMNLLHNMDPSGHLAAAAPTTTQTPPFHQRNTNHEMMRTASHAAHLHNARQPLIPGPNNYSAVPSTVVPANGAGLYSDPYQAVNPANAEPGYYTPGASAVGAGPGNRAQQVPGELANFTSNQQILDSLNAPNDAQIFEHNSQLRSVPLTAGSPKTVSGAPAAGDTSKAARDQRQKQQQQQRQQQSSLDATVSEQNSVAGDLSAGDQTARRRRRRSAEPMPQAPRHVPLQREIIVESTPGSAASANENRVQRSHGRGADSGGRKKADGLSRNGPAYDVNGQTRYTGAGQSERQPPMLQVEEHQQQQHTTDNNGTLLCTTRHSLVLASIAFCTVQLVTIALCLVTWMHKRDTKFKPYRIRIPERSRLYELDQIRRYYQP